MWINDIKEPLYMTIKRDVLSKIERGTWVIGHRLPSEGELEKQYRVSRGTVRRALRELEVEGYITRRSGKGTFVTRVTPKLDKPTGEIRSFTRQLAEAGLELNTKVLFAGTITALEANARVREGFGLPSDALVIHIKRLRLGNDTPLALQAVYLLPERCPGILNENLIHLFNLYEEKYNCRILAVDEIVRVAEAAKEETELLQLEPGRAVVIRDRVSYDQHGYPFEVLHSVDRIDSFSYRYRITNDFTRVLGPEEQGLS